ncbi:MAG: hypothetical protein HFP81_00590 [Methylococcales symbiont of Hymedesmia sp. n. MRB-2018]|nr:MAG: hypothetical protein HFP78_02090 [Methylococcales symbiont of Hymedesmia sp. n. MRB-2018]KAF3984734.1 MAG: hypothetical protein HFP81_00590 [Methylococcales symbiont of Hymedesmia sp. n. MRB-2018]
MREQQGVFYIFVSELASHTQNILQTSVASLLFIQSEQQAQNIFAGEGVVFECSVNDIPKEDDCFETQLVVLRKNLIKLLIYFKG